MTNATITLNAADALADIYDARRTKFWVIFNTDSGRVTDADGVSRLGAGEALPDSAGIVTLSGIPVPSGSTNPTNFQVMVCYDAPAKASNQRDVKRERGDFGWMTVTSDANLKDLEAEQYAPPNYLVGVTGELAGYAADAEAARDAAVDISNISTPDSLVQALVKNTGGAGPLTSAALSASIDAAIEPVSRQSRPVAFRGRPLGPIALAASAFPTVTFGSGNAASTITSVTDIYVGEAPGAFVGNYNPATTYTAGQGVNVSGDIGSMLWVALKTTTGVAPGTDATVWRKGKLDPRFGFYGDPVTFWQIIDSGQSIWQNGVRNAFVTAGPARSVCPAIQYVGTSIDLLFQGVTNQQVLLHIDGVTDPAGWRFTGSDGQTHRLNLTWASRDTHQIIVEVSGGYFHGVGIEPKSAIAPADVDPTPVLAVMGDSISAAQGLDHPRLSYAYLLAQILGCEPVVDAEGGTGNWNVGSTSGFNTTVARLPRLAANCTPDIVMDAVGLNDQDSADYANATAVSHTTAGNWITTARALFPHALLVGVGPFFTCDRASDSAAYDSIAAVRDGQLLAWKDHGATTLVAPGVWTGPGVAYLDADGWLNGKKGVGGTADVLLQVDGIHPNAIGERHFARRIAAALNLALPTAGYVL